MSRPRIVDALDHVIFSRRPWVIGLLLLITLFMGYSATNIGIDASFSKLLPLDHDYMKTFTKYREEFGGANRIIIALMVREGDIFTPDFFETLRKATDEVFFIPGVDRTRVQSLFTPNVRFTEVVEDGIAAGNVVPADFEPTPEGLAQVRENVLKAKIVGRLVANDFSGAIISAQLLEFNPNTGEPLDYIFVARELEEKIRASAAYQKAIKDAHELGIKRRDADQQAVKDNAKTIEVVDEKIAAVRKQATDYRNRILRSVQLAGENPYPDANAARLLEEFATVKYYAKPDWPRRGTLRATDKADKDLPEKYLRWRKRVAGY